MATTSPPPQPRDDKSENIDKPARASMTTMSNSASDSDSPGNAGLDEEVALKMLAGGVQFRDQDELERDITFQASQALVESEDKKDEKRIERAEARKNRLQVQRRSQELKSQGAFANPSLKFKVEREIARLDAEIDLCEKDVVDLKLRIRARHHDGASDLAVASATSGQRLPSETKREYLIRTGKITPFARLGGSRPNGVQGELVDVIIEAEDEAAAAELEEKSKNEPRSHQNLRLPGFADEPDFAAAPASEFSLRPRKKRRLEPTAQVDFEPDFVPTDVATPESNVEAEFSNSDDYDFTEFTSLASKRKAAKTTVASDEQDDVKTFDDGDESKYQKRLVTWIERRSRARKRFFEQSCYPSAEDDDGVEEWFKPSPDKPDHQLDNDLKLPGDIYPSLFDYQKTGVQWLAELYSQNVGGIIGDEMGLGKTVQLISFVAALHYSQMLKKPVIVVAPATVLRQWVNEFHRWWPPLRVSILHSSGSGMLNLGAEGRIEDADCAWDYKARLPGSNKAAKRIVSRVVEHGHVLVTTYAGLQTYGDVLIPVNWGYAVLDEGHKIRNPNTAITVYCKELRTPNRIILSGTPMQNNLQELWSLFDFIYPMRLGTLVTFRNEFEIPIRLGGYANATNLQIMTAQKCAETLKETISPYLLQRLKIDVASDLPKKSEQVLFCNLTRIQRDAYECFLRSDDMTSILNKSRQSLYGIDILRKICNHPDLLDKSLRYKNGYVWGSAEKSGKMQVVQSLLPVWKRLNHKTLLFCQGVQMLDVLERFISQLDGISYIRMDGKTPIKERQTLVDRFNSDQQLNVFLMTTKVGGLGVNLTGANRVIIFDPDWNPSTDVQARERAWRLGQKREVTIYRLMTAGTIEEKIYHRQIFKQFLSNKVLKDPKQRTTFDLANLHDLFTLGTYQEGRTETSEMFRGSEVKFSNDSGRDAGRDGKDSASGVTVPAAGQGDDAAGMQICADENDNDESRLREIEGIAGIEAYEAEEKAPKSEEERLMKGLFARSGLHSALEHDEIVNGRKKVKADPRILQQEANRIAAQAARHLHRAGEEARNVPIGTVTWTGEVGETGRPTSNVRRGRGRPSSAGILNTLADRQGVGSNWRPERPAAVTTRDFEQLIPQFIRRHNGKVPSKLLVDHFNRYCNTEQQAAEFKATLDKVAKLEKAGSSLRGIWSLKPGIR